MTITATVIADSISPAGKRITTMQLRYPRFIHAEFMTHRMFSRNASSSRAIPVQKMIEDLRRDPAMPVFWGSNKPGMQAGAEVDSIHNVSSDWLEAMENAIYKAEKLMASGLHKQIANRILEPWAHINVVVTATEWKNFFKLRCHPDAQPEMKALADAIRDEMYNSIPKLLNEGEWHLPYIKDEDWKNFGNIITQNGVMRVVPMYQQMVVCAKQVSVARCARVSYLTHEGKETSIAEDMALYNKLVVSEPLHASPAEHQATPDATYPNPHNDPMVHYQNSEEHGNFVGWRQLRKMLPNENLAG